MEKSFSVDLSKIQPTQTSLDREIEKIDDKLSDIYRRAVINDMPLVQMIVAQFNPSADDCKMLSRVFAALAQILPARQELQEQKGALKLFANNPEWLYEKIGDTTRDLDTFLQEFNKADS